MLCGRDMDVLTLNRPGFSESGTAGGGGGIMPPCVTSLSEDQWPWNLVLLYYAKNSTRK